MDAQTAQLDEETGAAETAEDSAIRVQGLQKTYAGTKKAPPKHALKGIDLDIPKGSVFGLLGPNGAGKSTLINILAGLVTKTSGQVSIWGRDMDKQPRQARAAIGVVPQEINIDPFFTPKECLEIQAGLYGVPKSERRTAEILELVGLTEKANAYVRQLSGGMRRRLLVAKAMVHSPPVLILDEPTAGVDIELRRQLWEAVGRLADQGVTVVLTTHYLEEAERLCEQIAIIHNGQIVANEPTGDMLKRLDRKRLVIMPRAPIEHVPESLSDLNADLDPDGRLTLDYRPSEMGVGRILERLHDEHIRVKDISTVEADLEDVFLELTYRASAADN